MCHVNIFSVIYNRFFFPRGRSRGGCCWLLCHALSRCILVFCMFFQCTFGYISLFREDHSGPGIYREIRGAWAFGPTYQSVKCLRCIFEQASLETASGWRMRGWRERVPAPPTKKDDEALIVWNHLGNDVIISLSDLGNSSEAELWSWPAVGMQNKNNNN